MQGVVTASQLLVPMVTSDQQGKRPPKAVQRALVAVSRCSTWTGIVPSVKRKRRPALDRAPIGALFSPQIGAATTAQYGTVTPSQRAKPTARIRSTFPPAATSK